MTKMDDLKKELNNLRHDAVYNVAKKMLIAGDIKTLTWFIAGARLAENGKGKNDQVYLRLLRLLRLLALLN